MIDEGPPIPIKCKIVEISHFLPSVRVLQFIFTATPSLLKTQLIKLHLNAFIHAHAPLLQFLVYIYLEFIQFFRSLIL